MDTLAEWLLFDAQYIEIEISRKERDIQAEWLLFDAQYIDIERSGKYRDILYAKNGFCVDISAHSNITTNLHS